MAILIVMRPGKPEVPMILLPAEKVAAEFVDLRPAATVQELEAARLTVDPRHAGHLKGLVTVNGNNLRFDVQHAAQE